MKRLHADAIQAGHAAVEVIDELIRDLHSLRADLLSELRADCQKRAERVDAMLAVERARREGGPR